MNIMYMTLGNKLYFYPTDSIRRTQNIARKFIKAILTRKKASADTIKKCLHDAKSIAQIQNSLTRGTVETKETPNGFKYHTIQSIDNNETINFPHDDFVKDTILIL